MCFFESLPTKSSSFFRRLNERRTRLHMHDLPTMMSSPLPPWRRPLLRTGGGADRNRTQDYLGWVEAQNGKVPPGAIAGGRERNNPNTFIGRFSLKDERKHIGRVVPSDRSCYAIAKAMEHKRDRYEVLVNPTDDRLVWLPDYQGHVPDTAVALNDGEPYYIGRVALGKQAVVPGRVVAKHGVLHVGYDNRETVKEEYDVLCRNTPCSLLYLTAKRIRDHLRARDKVHNAKYITRISNVVFFLERAFLAVVRKEPRRRRFSSEEMLELPRTLVHYLRSPKVPNLPVLQRLDFNTIMANCCPPEEECCCQMWVEVTLQGLY